VDAINRDLHEGKLTLQEISDKYGNYVTGCALGNHRGLHMKNYVYTPSVKSDISQRSCGKITDFTSHTQVTGPIITEAKVQSSNIDDLILDTKVKQIVLTTLKELGIR
jgi:hypothetical protein